MRILTYCLVLIFLSCASTVVKIENLVCGNLYEVVEILLEGVKLLDKIDQEIVGVQEMLTTFDLLGLDMRKWADHYGITKEVASKIITNVLRAIDVLENSGLCEERISSLPQQEQTNVELSEKSQSRPLSLVVGGVRYSGEVLEQGSKD